MSLNGSIPETNQTSSILMEREVLEEIKNTNPCFHNFLINSPTSIIPYSPYHLSIIQSQNSMSLLDIKKANYYAIYQLEGLAHFIDLRRRSLKSYFNLNKGIMNSFINYPYILEVTKKRNRIDKLFHVNIIMHLLPKKEFEQYVKEINDAVSTKQKAAQSFCNLLNLPQEKGENNGPR